MDAGVSLLKRTAARLQSQPFLERGGGQPNWNPYEPVLYAPRAGSFVIEIELAVRTGQSQSIFASSTAVVANVVEGNDLVQRGDLGTVREKIPEDAYFVHFCATSRELAPDGENVDLVDVTGGGRDVAFSVPRSRVANFRMSPAEGVANELISRTHEGTIEQGARADKREIGLKIEGRKGLVKSKVREGLEDVVKRHFGDQVRITVSSVDDQLTLDTLDPLDAD